MILITILTFNEVEGRNDCYLTKRQYHSVKLRKAKSLLSTSIAVPSRVVFNEVQLGTNFRPIQLLSIVCCSPIG